MIQGVEVKKLVRNADERGFLMELLRKDDPIFSQFGQAYISMNYPGIVRAWHYHRKQDDYFVCVKGMIKVALFDMREGSPTRGEVAEYYLGDDNNIVLRIPVGVAHGYKTVGPEPSLLINFPTETYEGQEPDEFRLPWDTDQIPYNWDIVFK